VYGRRNPLHATRKRPTLVGRIGIPFDIYNHRSKDQPWKRNARGGGCARRDRRGRVSLHGFARGGEQGLGVFAHGYDLELAVQGFEDLAGYF
jgi:hypothetical protein